MIAARKDMINKRIIGGLASVGVLLALSWFVYSRTASDEGSQIEVVRNKVNYDVSVKTSVLSPRVGERVTMGFLVQLDGRPINISDQQIYPHASVVSNDLGDVWFYHIDDLRNPAVGVYEFDHIFRQPSDYTIWFEINNNQDPQAPHHGNDSDYVARLAVDVQGSEALPSPVPAYAERSAISLSKNDYKLHLLPSHLQAGQAGTFTIALERADGSPVPLLPDFDHFFILVSPQHAFYMLDHPQFNRQGENKTTVKPIIFPEPGRYALWIRLFPDDGSGQPTDVVEGTLVLDVQE